DGVTWLKQLENLIDYMKAGLAETPEQFKYIPNVDALVTGWANLDLSHLDGAFLESFGDWAGGYNGSPGDWVLSMNRALPLAQQDKILIMQPYLFGSPDSTIGKVQRGFLLGTNLLLKGDHTYLNIFAPGSGLSAQYF